MCGICLMLFACLNDRDLQVMQSLVEYHNSFLDKEEDHVDTNTNTCSDNAEMNMQEDITNTNTITITPLLSMQNKELLQMIYNRGPDYLNVIEISNTGHIEDFNEDFRGLYTYEEVFAYLQHSLSCILISSVLCLRGISSLTRQPIYDLELNLNLNLNSNTSSNSNILQYNGEIYSISDLNLLGDKDIYKDNDGEILYSILQKFSRDYQLAKETLNTTDDNEIYSSSLFTIINSIESDHAFVFYDYLNGKIIINRDLFGKRSLLLLYFRTLNILMLTSVLTPSFYQFKKFIDIIEVPSNGVIIIDMRNTQQTLHAFTNPSVKNPSCIRFSSIESDYHTENILKDCFLYIKQAVYKRVANLPDIVKFNTSTQISIAVLFSGGIDSLILAYMTAINIPDELNVNIDLINLSFDKENAPDRNSGLIAFCELKKLLPSKKFNLILVDKNYTEDVEPMKDIVKALIYPKETHMDFNISIALKFATMLEGHLVQSEKLMEYYFDNYQNQQEISNKIIANYSNDILSNKLEKIKYSNFIEESIFKSSAKIVLSGLGADEFFGGYARYKTHYQNGTLLEEMSKDIDRIWTRNFGRDDRVCSDNGIELRFPFFDYDLLRFLSRVKDIKHVTNFDLGRGRGEKILLRTLCKELGLNLSSSFEKRAIQFGTKLAKETNVRKYGSNRKANGRAQFK